MQGRGLSPPVSDRLVQNRNSGFSVILRSGVPNIIMHRLTVACLVICFLFIAIACGVKAPPQPYRSVVPQPVTDLSVQQDPEGVNVTFTLPSKSLDGTPLESLGGYNILWEGPGGESECREIRFSVTEQAMMVGKAVDYPDALPPKTGIYYYWVLPVDRYGSHPRKGPPTVFHGEEAPAEQE